MRPLLFTLVSILMLPGLGECVDAPSRRLLYCVDVFDFEWDPEALETKTIGFEECTIDWSEEVYLYRVFYPESGLPIILTRLSKGEWFYRDETVEQGQRYQYRIRATYNCPNAGKKDVTLQLFNNYVIEMTDGCNGELKRDLILTGDFNEMKVVVKNAAKLTISGSTLEEPDLTVMEAGILEISGATIRTGIIDGFGGMVKIFGETQFVNSRVEFGSLENEFSDSTLIKKSDVPDPWGEAPGIYIRNDAKVAITNNDIKTCIVSVGDTPQVEIRNNNFRSTEIRVNTSTGHLADKVQILNNQFSEQTLDSYFQVIQGGAVISGNSFADSGYANDIMLKGGNIIFSNNQVVHHEINIGKGYYDRADVTLENNLIIGTYPDDLYRNGIVIEFGKEGGSTVRIDNCTITNHRTGISVTGGIYFDDDGEKTEVTVRNSCIADNHYYGLGSDDSAIVDAKLNWWGDVSGPKNSISNPDGQGNRIGDGIDFEPWLTSNNCQSALGYVDPNGDCGGKTPCFNSIQAAINEASSGSVIYMADGTYDEHIALNESKSLTLQGAWDSSFTSFKVRNGNTILTNAPVVTQGSLTLQELKIKPE